MRQAAVHKLHLQDLKVLLALSPPYINQIDDIWNSKQTSPQAELEPTALWPHSDMNMAGDDWWKSMHGYEEPVNESYYDDLVNYYNANKVQI